jgi:hypothetical protein
LRKRIACGFVFEADTLGSDKSTRVSLSLSLRDGCRITRVLGSTCIFSLLTQTIPLDTSQVGPITAGLQLGWQQMTQNVTKEFNKDLDIFAKRMH